MYASCVGAVTVSLSYQLLIFSKISVLLTLYMLIFVGILSAIPSAAVTCLVVNSSVYHEHYDKLITVLQFAGMLTIFPLWQTAFVWVMNMERFNPVSQKTATSI